METICRGLEHTTANAAKFHRASVLGQLKRLRDDHTTAATKLEEIILAMKGTSNFLGEKSALIALGEGENRGRSDYESALDDENVTTGCKDLIRDDLLIKTREHIATLRLIQTAT